MYSLIHHFIKNRYIVLILLCFPILSHAQFIINGSAADLGNKEYQLTPDQGGQVGTIWSSTKVSLANSFEVELELYFGTKDGNGADGITFSLQPQSNTVGVSGGGLGIGGITPSLITEMDTYQNGEYGDPSFDHIALLKNTVDHTASDNLVAPIQIVNGVNNVEDGAWYNFKATWNTDTKVFSISVNGNQRLFYQADLVNTIFNGDPMVYWGFTGSTGGLANEQKVRIINTTIIDIYPCSETANNSIFCNKTGPQSVSLSVGNIKPSTTYEWYTNPNKTNLVNTGISYNTPPLNQNTDYYVLAKTTGTTSTATIGPTPSGTLTDIWDANYTNGYHRNFTVFATATINSVEINHPEWSNGCAAIGSTKSAIIDLYQGATLINSKSVTANCGVSTVVPLNFTVNPGSYTLKLRGITGGNFRVTSDGSAKSIAGVITLDNNSITGPGGAISYSSVFFNWSITGGSGNSECMLTVKASIDCPPCTTYPVVNIDNDFTYCKDTDTSISVSTSATHVLWNTGETTKTINVKEGTYTVKAWDDVSCETYESIIVSKECPTNLIQEDTLIFCTGTTNQIKAQGIQTGTWSSSAPFTSINDSTISVNLSVDARYYVTNYTKLNILSTNVDFEDPSIAASSYSIVNASTVPGWETTASDNMIEIWSTGFNGVNAYTGKQFIELNANQNAALYQDVTTTPGQKIAISLAHRGRAGIDVMELLAGPPGGPFTSIKNYSDGLAWGYYTDYYTVPAGQNTTRFLFQTISCAGGPCGSSGNFLDAIEFSKIREENDSVYVKIKQPPLLNLGNDTTICGLNNYTLNAGNTGATYTWNTTATSQSINVTSSGLYGVTVTQNGCTSQDQILITFTKCLNIIEDTIYICQGDSAIVNAVGVSTEVWTGTETYKLINDSTINVKPNGPIAKYYLGSPSGDSVIVIVQNNPIINLGSDLNICLGDSQLVDAGIHDSYLWNTGAKTSKIYIKNAGQYSVEVTNQYGCQKTDEIVIQNLALPVVDLGKDTLICPSQTFTIDAQNMGMQYLWNTNETSQKIDVSTNGTYQVTVTDNNNCKAQDDITITVDAISNININAPLHVCQNDNVINVSASPLGGILYGVGINGNSFDTKNTNVKSGAQNWIYYEYTNANQCKNIDSVSIFIHVNPIVQLDQTKLEICQNETVAINALNTTLTKYEWYTTGITNSIGSEKSITTSIPGNYYLKVYTNFCSAYSDTANVIAINHEIVAIANPSSSIYNGESVEVKSMNIDSSYQYKWINSSTGETSFNSSWQVSPNVSSNYILEGTYKGCTSKDTVIIHVKYRPQIPNIITPNGDGIHDYLKIKDIEYFENAFIEIYNQWGELIYVSDQGYKNPWTGKINGHDAPIGTYYWIFYPQKEDYENLKGYVSVIR